MEVQEVSKIQRDTLLQDKITPRKDPQMILVCDWHPNLSIIPSILKKHYHLLRNDTKTSKIFTSPPTVAYRRPRCIKNLIVKNKSRSKNITSTTKCGKCKLCPNIKTSETVTNQQRNITIKINDGGNCRTRNVVYAAICKKCDLIYIGQTGEELRERFSNHRYDTKRRPDNNELAGHFHSEDHSFEKDLEVLILESGLTKSQAQREHCEDRWIARLQTLQETGINLDINQYAKDMYESFGKIN